MSGSQFYTVVGTTNSYSFTPIAGVTTYNFTVIGAGGGGSETGGSGGVVTATYNYTSSAALQITVGGGGSQDSNLGGGGGLTQVLSPDNSILYIVAGGGGGGGANGGGANGGRACYDNITGFGEQGTDGGGTFTSSTGGKGGGTVDDGPGVAGTGGTINTVIKSGVVGGTGGVPSNNNQNTSTRYGENDGYGGGSTVNGIAGSGNGGGDTSAAGGLNGGGYSGKNTTSYWAGGGGGGGYAGGGGGAYNTAGERGSGGGAGSSVALGSGLVDGAAFYKATDNINNNINGTLYGQGLGAGNTNGAVLITWTELISTNSLTNAPAISNICFPAGTPITTDQGIIAIDQIDTTYHTINNKPIQYITQTTSLDRFLVLFPRNSLGKNIPYLDTIMTTEHKVLYKDKMLPAYKFLNISKEVRRVKYNGEILYNVLQEEHSTMFVNNLICETLHPDNLIAKIYKNRFTDAYKENIINAMNDALLKRQYYSYKTIVDRINCD